ncbi:50S ribosomal protein L2 [Candidatus Falkowbacteria bacterium RIFCSPLOWO2_12_FULL_45_10]|uniref:Large ribosomal subunit protein uL2 n=3 Tax=Candidatus Falkowiibacteriota TaxID=1752728 RepID=A0A1F5RJL7_9BACT|nr:MAG: 50S ribosomal protein L2 [Candidatus Falkowbacteria bacterium RIFCSPHIGHO2_02_FULL_45_15]OGF19159.1 MAG: 50S ribosomal protein L2 [Candidatus Falkowbacteria bacterium RIFCSPLOWO2_12_FULL_45_10]OGF20180.1 MAG: 50S ribosomal protein L2 [Candidatus Falkowbacteria bacterium RIFCSPLOWO2_02_FULL_45_15]
MGIRKVKPITNALRQATFDDFLDITAVKPLKQLTVPKKKKGGRNMQGKITVRHQGGGAKQRVRLIDFKQDKFDIPATVKTIEYDPIRGARIALLYYRDGAKRYIIAPDGLKVGDAVMSSLQKQEIKIGIRLPLKYIPVGIEVHNVELVRGAGGKLARGAGNLVQVMAIDGDNIQLKLPSGEIRLVKGDCLATIGKVSNPDWRLISIGKAGRQRLLGIRPTVRGTAMNPVDHPHGGGEGKQSIGLKAPKTLWGKKALGVPTRKPKPSDRLIIQRRKNKKRK